MARSRGFVMALLLCGSLAACSDGASGQGDPSSNGGAAVAAPGTGGAGGAAVTTASGGAVGQGGSVGSGGKTGTGGFVSSGVGGGQGGYTGTGGAGGITPGQGGSTGSTTIPQVDLTCNTDNDCCVKSDTCRSVVVLYSKLQGLVYWPPSTSTSCLRCYTPAVEVSCKNNKCTGTVTNAMGTSGVKGVESHCGKVPGAGLATSQDAGAAVLEERLALPPTPSRLADLPPTFGCGM
jgi:hypothetical protein